MIELLNTQQKAHSPQQSIRKTLIKKFRRLIIIFQFSKGRQIIKMLINQISQMIKQRLRISIIQLDANLENQSKINKTNEDVKQTKKLRPSVFLNNLNIQDFLPPLANSKPQSNKHHTEEQQIPSQSSINNDDLHLPLIKSPYTLKQQKRFNFGSNPQHVRKQFRSPVITINMQTQQRKVLFRNSIKVVDLGDGTIQKDILSEDVKPLRRIYHRPTRSNIN
ncbi:hypothetical protein pb186bvf_005150 [Paramecium bursaria]